MDCTIYRVRTSRSYGGGAVRALRAWQARCPECGPMMTGSPVWPDAEPRPDTYKSRKLAKDALHRHRRTTGH